ncbi:hypothetical protein AB0O47_40050 [Streptomyces noursei]|uniref:hypothetical protein n=1 Tax=Streptomyces noursei TaxID=1971 RepID=UPI00344C6FAB
MSDFQISPFPSTGEAAPRVPGTPRLPGTTPLRYVTPSKRGRAGLGAARSRTLPGPQAKTSALPCPCEGNGA